MTGPAVTTPAPTPTPSPVGSATRDADNRRQGGSEIANRLVARYGSEAEALRILSEENYDYRERHRTDTEEITRTRTKVPADGSVILTKEEGEQWSAFKGFKLKPEELKTKLEERDKLDLQVRLSEARDLHEQAAKLVSWNPKALSKVLKSEGLHLEIRDVEVEEEGETKTRKVPHVRPAKDEKAELKPLTRYVKDNLEEFLPALEKVTEEGTGSGKGGKTGTTTGGTGTRFPSQGGSTSKAPTTNQEAVKTYQQGQQAAVPWDEPKK